MKKFMIFLLMAFLYLGTSQASNEITSLSNDAAKSLHHWVVPSMSSPTLAAMPMAPIDSTINVAIVGPTNACAGEVVVLTAVVVNNYLGMDTFQWRLDGDFIEGGGLGLGNNQVRLTVPASSGGLDDLLHEIDVRVVKGCQSINAVHYIRVNSTNISLEDASVCPSDNEGRLVAHVTNNQTELPYAYVWYQNGTIAVDTTYVPFATLPVGTYVVEGHFTHSACITRSNEATISNVDTLKPTHLTLSTSADNICDGGQVTVVLNGLKDNYGTASIMWDVNGYEYPYVHDTIFTFSPSSITGDVAKYYIHASVRYSDYPCTTFTLTDTVSVSRDPSVSIAGTPIVCSGSRVVLNAIVHDTITTPSSYLWRVDGVDFVTGPTFDSILAARSNPYQITVVINAGTPCEAVSDVYSVYVGSFSNVYVTVAPTPACVGQEVVAVAHIGDNNLEGLTFSWKVNNVPVPHATESYIHYTISDTAKTVFEVLVNQNGTMCSVTGKDSVITNVNPRLDSIAIVSVQDDVVRIMPNGTTQVDYPRYGLPAYDVCEGAGIRVTAYMRNASGYYVDSTVSYVWRRNGVIMPGVTEYTFVDQLTTEDNDSYKYVYSAEIAVPSVPNCYSVPSTVTSDTVRVSRNPRVIIAGQHYFCEPADEFARNVLLRAWVDGVADAEASFKWYKDGMYEINPLNIDHGYMYTGKADVRYGFPYTYTVEVTNGMGCTTISDPFEVVIMGKPVVAITPYSDVVCKDGEVTLTANLSNEHVEEFQPVFQWYKNEVGASFEIPGATHAVYNGIADETTNYIVRVEYLVENTNYYTCEANDTVTVQVYDTPVITGIEMSLTEICEGSQVAVSAILDSTHRGVPGVPYIYKWYRNGELLAATDSILYDSPVTVDGNVQQFSYSVSVYQYPEVMLCESSRFYSTETLTVYPNPVVVVTGDQHVCKTGNIELTANVDMISNPVGGLHYYWFESGAPIVNLNGDSAVLSYKADPQDEPYRFVVQVERDSSITGCRSYSYEYQVYVYDYPVVSLTASNYNVCEGAQVTLTSHLEDINLENIVYSWYAGNTDSTIAPIYGASEPEIEVTVNDTTYYKVVATNTLSNCQYYSYVIVNTYEVPVITNITMSDSDICEGADVAITATVQEGTGMPNLPFYFEWRRNGELLPGNTSTIYDNPMTADGTTQTFTYTAIAYQVPGELACVSEIDSSAPLTVYANPRVEISGDQHICNGSNIVISANVDKFTEPVGELNYYWYESGRLIASTHKDTLTLPGRAKDEPYRFTVQIERGDATTGCRSYSNEYDVYVYFAPVANVTIVDQDVCKGAEVTLTAHLNNLEQTNLLHQWFYRLPGETEWNLIPGATELTYTKILDTTTEFRYQVVHSLSLCSDEDSATIYVHEIPVVTSVSMSDTNICEGADVTITANINNNMGVEGMPYYYEWRRNGELLAANTRTIHDTPMTTDGTNQTFVYSVIAYQTPERLACYSELVNSATLTVVANPQVVITGDQHICIDDKVFLRANVDTFSNVVSNTLHYTWYQDGEIIANELGDSKYLIWNHRGTRENGAFSTYHFTVQIERDNNETGCRSYSQVYDVTVYEKPEVAVTAVDTRICKGGEVNLTANLNLNTPEQTNLQYQWYKRTTGGAIWTPIPQASELNYITNIDTTTEFSFVVEHMLSGCADTAYILINVYTDPVVSTVSMSDTNICEGAQVTIYAATTGGVTDIPMYYEWRRNGELLEGNTATIYDSPVVVDGNEQTFYYSVIAYQSPERLGCASGLVSSATLNVYPNPVVAISGDQHVCETDSIFLVANVDTIGRPVGLLHYTWYESGRLRDNMAYGLGDSRYYGEYFYPQTEPYRFTVEVQRDNIAAGCRSYSEEFLVWVYEEPVVNITSTEDTICAGGNVTLTAHLDNYAFTYANNSEYQWYEVTTDSVTYHVGYNPDGTYRDTTIVVDNVTPIPGATTLTYTTDLFTTSRFGFSAVHTASGCNDYDEIEIQVNPIPVVDSIQLLSEQDTICPGGRVTLLAHVSGGVPSGQYEYTWYRNGQVIESNGPVLIDYPTSEDGTITRYIYQVVVRQPHSGCESILTPLTPYYLIWVAPHATIELAGDPIVCDTTENNVVIHANIVYPVEPASVGGYTYQWFENNVAIEGETDTILSIHKPYRDYPYSFNFVAYNGVGCEIASGPFMVYVNDNPHVVISADDESICAGGTVTLTSTLYDQHAENLTYHWLKKDVNDTAFVVIPGANNPTYTTTLTDTTTFRFYVYQRDSHCAANSNELTINVNPIPEITSITLLSEDTAICDGHPIHLLANVVGGQSEDDMVFTWYKNGVVVENADIRSYRDYPVAVDNDVTAYIYNVTVSQTSSGCTSEHQLGTAVQITVRPNPVFNVFGDQDVCVTDTVVLHAHSQGIPIGTYSDYTMTWYVDGHRVDGQNSLVFNVQYPAREYPYNFKFKSTDGLGCTTETENYPVMVYHKPHVRLTASESDICTNGTVTLTAHLFDQNEENLTYMWQKDVNGTFEMIEGANEATYTTTLDSTTDFRVLVFQTNSECLGISDTMTINVVNAPVVTNITVLSEDTVICEGHQVSLRANISGGVVEDEVTYTWYKNGVIIEGANEAYYTDYPVPSDNTVPTRTQFRYNVTVAQTSSACYSLYDTNDVVLIEVRPNPNVYVNGLENVCQSSSDNNIVLQATVAGNVGSLTDYVMYWYEDDTVIVGQNTDVLDINRPYRDQVYNFKFGLLDAHYGCTVVSDYFYVNVHHIPGVTATVDQDTICDGGYATLTATLVNQNESNLIYQWHKNDDGEWHAVPGANNLTYTTDELTNTTKYKLAVVNLESGCQNFSNEVTVNVHPTPTIDIVSQSAFHICDGGSVHFIATPRSEYAGLGDVTYQWYVNGVAIEGANSSAYYTNPLTVDGDHTIYEYAVRAIMTHSACVSRVDTAIVHVHANPTVEITYNNGLVLCEGGSTTLTANAHHMYFFDPNQDNFSYQWFMNGLPIPGANSKTYVVSNLHASADSYVFTVVVAVNPGNQTGCNAVSEPVAVTIVPDPIANITVAEDVNAICEGGVVTFNVNIEGGVADAYNPYTYAWYNNFNPNTVLGDEVSFTTSVNDPAALYTYWVDVTSQYGCNVRATYSGFEIVADPTVAIAVVPGADAAVCNGGHTQLMANVEGGLGEVSYQWYKNGVALTGETNQTLTTEPLYVNQTAAYTVAIAQTGIACTATSTQFNVPVYENIDVTINTNSYINCVGGSVILTAEAVNAIPNDQLNYQWYRTYNGISTAINGATNYVYNTAANLVPGTYEYSVQVSSNISGCQVALSSSLAITVENEPTVTIYSDDADNVICQGGNLTLYANVTYPTNSTNHNNQYRYTWKWYQAGALMTAQTTSPQYTISNTLPVGTYNFFVDINSNDGLGCDATSQAEPFAVIVNPIPVVTIVPSATQSCEGGSISVTAQVIPTNLTGAYAWTVNGEAVPSIQNTIVLSDLPLGTNTISVVFIPDNACQSDVATITHEVITTPVVTVTPDDEEHTLMCAGGRIALTASATGNANYQYEWMVDGQTLPGFHGSNLSRELEAAGTYSFQARVISTLGCNSAYSVPVVVSVAEQPEVAISQIAGYSDMCVGGEISLMAVVTNYSNVNEGVTNNTVHSTYNYVWKRDGNDFAANTGVEADRVQIDQTLNTPASYLYSVTVTADGYNCQPATAVLDHSINVVPDPTWTVNQVAPAELCLGGVVFLNAEVTGGVQTQQAGQIQWYKTLNGIETTVAGLGGVNTDIPESAGVYSYMPKYIDYNGVGCNIEPAAATQVVVNALPTAEFTMGSGEVLCASSSLDYATLEITLTGTAPFTFTIMNVTTGETQTIVTSLTTYSYNVHPSTTTVYRLVSVVDANGCEGSVNGVADAVVYISDVEVVTDHVVLDCETFSSRIYVNVNSSLSYVYYVTYPNGDVEDGILVFDNDTHLYYAEINMEGYAAGDYTVILSIEGCESVVDVTVPANNLSMGLSTDFVDQRWDDVVVVNNNPDNNGGYKFFSYQWYRNGQAIPGATGQYYQEEGGLNGFYSVEVNGIRVSDNAQVHFVTCEIYFSSASQIKVYPVPATSTQEVFIELNMTNEELEGAILDIYDVKGAHIKSMTNLTPITKVSSFGAQGTYFGRIITGTNEIKTVKFIIVK